MHILRDMQIERMDAQNAGAAAELLLERLRAERRAGRPWDPAALETPAPLEELIVQALGKTEGHVCTVGDRATAFIQAFERDERPWVPSFWIEFLGHAAQDPLAYRHLYAHVAKGWVDRGRLDHFVVVPALEDVVWTFFGLGFGLEQVYAIRPLDHIEARDDPSIDVRLATPDDFDALKALFGVLPAYQQRSPTFGLNTITAEELEEGHAELLADDSVHYWIALAGGVAVGFMIFEPVDDPEAPHYPQRTISLDVAAVAEGARGSGIGSLLTSAGLRHAAGAGFTHCLTDWRSPNLTSGPIWTRWGFEPYAYRLHRTIDARLGPSASA